jgi:hypothetical protein
VAPQVVARFILDDWIIAGSLTRVVLKDNSFRAYRTPQFDRDNDGPNLGGVSGDGGTKIGAGLSARGPASFYRKFDDINVKYLLTKLKLCLTGDFALQRDLRRDLDKGLTHNHLRPHRATIQGISKR